jgi:hypothetical protein
VFLTGISFSARDADTEPPAGEHSENLERWSIPKCRSCPGRLVRSPVALMGCRAG